MCNGAGFIVTKKLDIFFSEADPDGDMSHSQTLERLRMKDNTDPFQRDFVRVQYPNYTPESFEFDENATLPAWAEEDRQEIIEKCNKVLAKIFPAWEEYDRVCDTAWEKYNRVVAPAWAEYNKASDTAWEEYDRVVAPAREEYDRVCDTAWEKYIKALSSINGFVPE